MNQVMIDMETLGTSKRCVLLSIGLVQFDLNTGECGKTLHLKIRPEQQIKMDREVTKATIDWWQRQKPEARQILEEAKTGIDLIVALDKINEFIRPIKGATVWSNGADFDIAILQEAYLLADRQVPWVWYKNRCVRTVHDLVKDLYGISCKNQVQPPVVAHDAIEDCKFQIRYTVEAIKILKGKNE